ncbi:DUF4276 family protein [Streptomyces sp. NPDC059740]|uniref:DUF4276 family protein n=1 Tax=Streptomyces sp. NPDC059740 TaxID=3346926 RepID=UPI003666EF9A
MLPGLAQQCRISGDKSQVLVTTHSHDFFTSCKPQEVKEQLDALARGAGLTPRADSPAAGSFTVLNRIAMREWESWYFGDWPAVRAGFPKVAREAPRSYRGNLDVVAGKCSDAFEKVLFAGGVRLPSKPGWGRRVGPHLKLEGNRSPSFRAFVAGVREIAGIRT